MKITFTTAEHRLALMMDILESCDSKLTFAILHGRELHVECEVPEERLSKFRMAAEGFCDIIQEI